MIALSLRFPAGRYHATPWGRHVNEAAVAWPPEPLRIMRALIACHHRKADAGMFSGEDLAGLVDALSAQLPIYRLPEAVHAHTRHYMPAPVKTTLVFDAFSRFDPDEPLIVGWPDVTLTVAQRTYFEHLAARLSYLGRAESWVDAVVIEWGGRNANAWPAKAGESNYTQTGRIQNRGLIHLYAPLASEQYRETRERLLDVASKRGKDFRGTLPEHLAEALAIDTSVLQSVGWSDPPAVRRVLYSAPELRATWSDGRRQRLAPADPNPTVARFVLAGRPRPQVEDTVKIAEIMRLAAMAKFGWETIEGKRRPRAPSVISGYGTDGKALRDESHGHAFWLPEDADGDGEIDHVIVYVRAGLDKAQRQKLDRVVKLWIDGRAADDEEAAEPGSREWRLALEGFGSADDFASASDLLGSAHTWISVTPYLMPWHAKKGFEWFNQIEREVRDRGLPGFSKPPQECGSLAIRGRDRRPVQFYRFRSRRGLMQPDTLGRFVRLSFETRISGPLAVGFGCHFGLGLFRSEK
jgi:CRISPR-associated protein Csb2